MDGAYFRIPEIAKTHVNFEKMLDGIGMIVTARQIIENYGFAEILHHFYLKISLNDGMASPVKTDMHKVNLKPLQRRLSRERNYPDCHRFGKEYFCINYVEYVRRKTDDS